MSLLFSILTGMGVGSGGLYILWLTLARNVAQSKAQGLNLIFFSVCVIAASLVNIRCHRIATKPLSVILLFGVFSCIPAAFLAQGIDSALLSRLFGGLLVLLGAVGLFSS